MSVLTAYKHIVRRVVETQKSGTLCCFMSIKHNLIYKYIKAKISILVHL